MLISSVAYHHFVLGFLVHICPPKFIVEAFYIWSGTVTLLTLQRQDLTVLLLFILQCPFESVIRSPIIFKIIVPYVG